MAVTDHKRLAEVQCDTDSATPVGLTDTARGKLMARPNREKAVVNLPQRFARKTTQFIENK